MKFSEVLTYPMPPAALEAMSCDPAFVASRFALLSIPVHVNPNGRGILAHADVNVSALPEGLLPDSARSFLPPTLNLTFTEEWSGEGDTRFAHSVLEVQGAPVRLEAYSTCSATPADPQHWVTQRSAEGEATVSIPFFGGRVEQHLISRLAAFVAAESQCAAAWIAAHGV